MSQCEAAPNAFKCYPAESMALEVPSSQKLGSIYTLPSPQGLRTSAPGSAFGVENVPPGNWAWITKSFPGVVKWVGVWQPGHQVPTQTWATFPYSPHHLVPGFHLCSSHRNRDAIHWIHGSESWCEVHQCPSWATQENHNPTILTSEHINMRVETLLHLSGAEVMMYYEH